MRGEDIDSFLVIEKSVLENTYVLMFDGLVKRELVSGTILESVIFRYLETFNILESKKRAILVAILKILSRDLSCLIQVERVSSGVADRVYVRELKALCGKDAEDGVKFIDMEKVLKQKKGCVSMRGQVRNALKVFRRRYSK